MRKSSIIMISVFFVMMTLLVFAAMADEALQKLLSLEGKWEGQYEGQTIRLTYEPISQKTALW